MKFFFQYSLCLFLLFNSYEAIASHSMGADLTYECLGGNTYRLKLSFYRDCSGVEADSFANIHIFSNVCNLNLNVRLYPIPGTGVEITPLCPSAVSTCQGGTFTGIQEWIYEGDVTLPAQCPDWTFSYNLCCRNAAITTIQNPDFENIYISSTLNNTISPCNNSPFFSNKPVPFLCLGSTFHFNNGAFDNDGDSLAFQLITPRTGPNMTVNYFPGYSPQQPLTSNPPMTFDLSNADYSITPQALEVTVMAVVVSEYRNGVLIGSVERDIQVTVIACTNILPELSGINGTSKYDTTVCANTPICFDVFSNDSDVSQDVTLAWDQSISNATFTIGPGNRPSGHFCWTPTIADASTSAHCFTASVTDNACPYLGSGTRAYCITVGNLTVDAGLDQVINCYGQALINATSVTNSGTVTYQWSNGINTASQSVDSGKYVVSATNGTCTTSDSVMITEPALPIASFNVVSGCIDSPVQFTDQSAGNGNAMTWRWNFGDADTSVQQFPVHHYNAAGNYNVCLIADNGNNCIDTICNAVVVHPLPVVFAGNNVSICYGQSANLIANGAATYIWSDGDTSSNRIVSPLNNISYILTGRDTNGCMDADTMDVAVNPQIMINPFSGFICPGQSALLDAGAHTPDISYAWSTGDTTQSIIADTTGNFSVTLTDLLGCTNSESSVVMGGGLNFVDNTSTADICNGTSTTFDAGNNGSHYIWSSGDTTQIITVATAGIYNVIVTDAAGCTISFNSTLITDPVPVASFAVAPVCFEDSSLFVNNSAITRGDIISFQWNLGDGNISAEQNPHHLYSLPGTYPVNLTLISDSGCVSSVQSSALVNPLPVANFYVADNCFGFNSVMPGASYVFNDSILYQLWNLGDGTVSYGDTVSHLYSHPGNYPVVLVTTTSHGCTDTANKAIQINPLPVADAGPDISICSGDVISLGDSAVADVQYVWFPDSSLDNHLIAHPAYSLINNGLNNHLQTFFLTSTDALGCVNSDSVNVEVRPVPPVSFSAPLPQCLEENSFVFLPSGAADANASLIWDFGSAAQQPVSNANQPPPVKYMSAGNHIVTLQYTYGSCPGPATIDTVTVWNMPVADFIPDKYDGCIPLTVTFYNVPPEDSVDYQWNIDGNNLSGLLPQWTFNEAGTYSANVVATNQHQCVTRRIIDRPIETYPLPVASFYNEPAEGRIYESQIQFYNTSQSGVEYAWDFGDGTTEDFYAGAHNYTDTGTYDVTMITTTEHGCLDSTYGKIRINEGFSFYVPNAITPNDDGKNDFFQGYGTFLHSYRMSIYDRWGKKIYYTEDYNQPWDGRIDSEVQSDTYVYRIVVSDYTGKEHVYLGDVSVVR